MSDHAHTCPVCDGYFLCDGCDDDGPDERLCYECRGARITQLETALQRLVDALPTCAYCGDPATVEHVDWDDVHMCYACDECSRRQRVHAVVTLDHAAGIRAALRELREPKGDVDE